MDEETLFSYSQINKSINRLCKSKKFWLFKIKRFGSEYITIAKDLLDYNLFGRLLSGREIYAIIRRLYLAKHKVPIEPLNLDQELDAFGYIDTSNFKRYAWTIKSFQQAATFDFPFSKEDIFVMVKRKLWNVLDRLTAKKYNQLRTDIYFLSDKPKQLEPLLLHGQPSKKAWNMFFQKKGIYGYMQNTKSRNGSLNLKTLDILIRHNIQPPDDCTPIMFYNNEIETFIAKGLRVPEPILYSTIFSKSNYKDIGRYRSLHGYNFENLIDFLFSRFHYELTLKKIKYMLSLGIRPKASLALIGKCNNDEFTLFYIKLIQSYRVVVPKDLIEIIIQNMEKSKLIHSLAYFKNNYI